MTDDNLEYLDLIDPRKLREYISLTKMLADLGITQKQVIERDAYNIRQIKIERVIKHPSVELKAAVDKFNKCPECGTLLSLYAIEEKNKKEWKSRWFCDANMLRKKGCKGCEDDDTDYTKGCGYERLDKRNIEEIHDEYQKIIHDLASKEVDKMK